MSQSLSAIWKTIASAVGLPGLAFGAWWGMEVYHDFRDHVGDTAEIHEDFDPGEVMDDLEDIIEDLGELKRQGDHIEQDVHDMELELSSQGRGYTRLNREQNQTEAELNQVRELQRLAVQRDSLVKAIDKLKSKGYGED